MEKNRFTNLHEDHLPRIVFLVLVGCLLGLIGVTIFLVKGASKPIQTTISTMPTSTRKPSTATFTLHPLETIRPTNTQILPTRKPVLPKATVKPPPATSPLCDIHIDPNQQVRLSIVELVLRPPFYDGPIPLKYQIAKTPGIGMGLGSTTLISVFDEWKTIYDYSDPSFPSAEIMGIATCAQTFNNSGQLLAEAHLEKIVEENRIEILEIHYNEKGKVQFWAKSNIEWGSGYKIDETEAYGIKIRDYYFIWPVTSY